MSLRTNKRRSMKTTSQNMWTVHLKFNENMMEVNARGRLSGKIIFWTII